MLGAVACGQLARTPAKFKDDKRTNHVSAGQKVSAVRYLLVASKSICERSISLVFVYDETLLLYAELSGLLITLGMKPYDLASHGFSKTKLLSGLY